MGGRQATETKHAPFSEGRTKCLWISEPDHGAVHPGSQQPGDLVPCAICLGSQVGSKPHRCTVAPGPWEQPALGKIARSLAVFAHVCVCTRMACCVTLAQPEVAGNGGYLLAPGAWPGVWPGWRKGLSRRREKGPSAGSCQLRVLAGSNPINTRGPEGGLHTGCHTPWVTWGWSSWASPAAGQP